MRKKVLAILMIFLIQFYSYGCFVTPKIIEQEENTIKNTDNDENVPDIIDPENIETISYEIIHIGSAYDNIPEYYVLIEPIDRTDKNYKEEIKKLVCKIVGENDYLISIWFFDNLKVLEDEYNYLELGDDSVYLDDPDSFFKNEDLHSIAGYDGGNKNGPYFYSIWFFSANDEDSEIIDFDPGDMMDLYNEIISN